MSIKKRVIIKNGRQITLPQEFIDKFNLKEGASLDLEIKDDGEIRITPLVQAPMSQKWFWTDDWQEGEQEADEDIKQGRVEAFEDVHDLIAELEND